MKRNDKKFNSKRVAVYAKRRAASKTFLGLYIVPLTIGCVFGTGALIGTSIFSGFGYFEQDKYVTYLRSLKDENGFDSKYGNFKTEAEKSLNKKFSNPVAGRRISAEDYDSIMEILWDEFYRSFKIPMPDSVNVIILGSIKTLNTQPVDNTIGTQIINSFDGRKSDILTNVGIAVDSIIFNMWGEQLPNNTFTKSTTWSIVFGVSTAIAGIMVLSLIAYIISRIIERCRAADDVRALRKVVEVANDEEIEYIMSKINRRYSFN